MWFSLKMIVINPYRFGTSSSLTYEGNATSVGANTDTLNVSVGAASTGRIVVACIMVRKDTAVTYTVTIGGQTATVVQQVGTTGGGNSFTQMIAWASVPTGTTADVVISNAANDGWGVEAYSMVGYSTTAVDSGAKNGTITPSVTLSTSANGVIIAGATSNPPYPAIAWTGDVTKDDEFATGQVSSDVMSCASGVTDGSPATATATVTGGGTGFTVALAVSFEPI